MTEPSQFEAILRARAGDHCELCGATDELDVREVPPAPAPSADASVLVCATCLSQIGFTAKRGTLVKGIRLTGDPEHVDGRVNKVAIVLKTRFLKKVV